MCRMVSGNMLTRVFNYMYMRIQISMTGIYMFNLFDFFFTNKENNESPVEYFQSHYWCFKRKPTIYYNENFA